MIPVEILLGLLQKVAFLASSVSKGSFFPQPLCTQEEASLISRKIQGDKAAAGKLVEHNLRLVAHIAKKYKGMGREMDDLVSIGTIGLIKAVNTFNNQKGAQLATYAARCIENEILMTIRSARKQRNEVYMDDPIGSDREGNEISLSDVLGTDQDEVVDLVNLRIQTERLKELIRQILGKRERRVIELRYGLDGKGRLTQKEIGAMLGISRSYVSRIEKQAVQKLNRAFNSM